MKRRQFIGRVGNASLFLLAGGISSCIGKSRKESDEFVFIEAEQFADFGGWDLDQQSTEIIGSSYLLAHGLGRPVADATTKVRFPSAGTYRVWVRTRDWVAPWNAPGAPGKFQLLVNSKPLDKTFGTKGAAWDWHDGGVVNVSNTANIALHDLTGFEGRCDSILFCKDLNFKPSNELKALTAFRRKLLGLSDKPADGGAYDFAVIGGGFAGACAALSAARNGLSVVLVQDRSVLGGNGSSEVRVWPEGHIQKDPFPHIGDIVKEMAPDRPAPRYGSRNALTGDAYDDDRKMKVIKVEPRITLLTEERAIDAEIKDGNIVSVTIQNTRTAKRTKITAKYFSDFTGDATIGAIAGADFEMTQQGVMGMSNLWYVMDASSEKEVLACECKDKEQLTTAFEQGDKEQPFPRCPWALDLSDKPFPGRKNFKGQWGSKEPLGNLGGWFWESGFDKNPITDVEQIRDHNFRAMYGAWDALKNVDKQYPNHRLAWSAFIAGKRESRRLMGDVFLTADHFKSDTKFDDPAFPCSWHIDVHKPHEEYDDGLKGQEFISKATTGSDYAYHGIYWAPYRTLYSRNINNLFMAGRNISVSQDGLGPVRVMLTCGMMGETVGKAAALCVKHKTSPRDIYESYLDELKELMNKPGKDRV